MAGNSTTYNRPTNEQLYVVCTPPEGDANVSYWSILSELTVTDVL